MLEKIYNNQKTKGKRIRVFNLAQINGTQTQDILNTVLFVSKIKPKIVVSLTGWNELISTDIMSNEMLYKYRVFGIGEVQEFSLLQTKGKSYEKFKESFYHLGSKYFETIKMMTFLLPPDTRQPRKMEEKIDIGTEIFLENLENLIKLQKAYNFTHYQFMQPHLYSKLSLSPDEQNVIELYDNIRPINGGVEVGNFLRKTNIYYGIISNTIKNKSKYGRVIDLSDIFKYTKDERHFTLVHLNDQGYNDVAKQIHDVIFSGQ